MMDKGQTTHTLPIDGLEVVFQDAPVTEAPAEFHIYFPAYGALCPDTEVARRFVECMDGEQVVLDKARAYFDKGDYRWTVELTRQLVFFNSLNREARNLQADALTRLAYSFEATTWRNIFLSAASELGGHQTG